MDNKTPSRTSPRGGKRACLCKDNTYSSACCDGSLQAQGIGLIDAIQEVEVIPNVQVENNENN